MTCPNLVVVLPSNALSASVLSPPPGAETITLAPPLSRLTTSVSESVVAKPLIEVTTGSWIVSALPPATSVLEPSSNSGVPVGVRRADRAAVLPSPPGFPMMTDDPPGWREYCVPETVIAGLPG